MPLKTQSCKGKGRRLQQAVARDIIAAFDHLQEDDVRSTSMGAGGEDVQLSPAARAAMPYSIECKNTERLNLWGALEQCKGNAPAGATPLVVFKRNRSDTYAVVPWPHLVRLRKRVRTAGPVAGPAQRRVLGIGYSGELPKGCDTTLGYIRDGAVRLCRHGHCVRRSGRIGCIAHSPRGGGGPRSGRARRALDVGMCGPLRRRGRGRGRRQHAHGPGRGAAAVGDGGPPVHPTWRRIGSRVKDGPNILCESE